MNLCIITGIFPPDIGGPATYVSRLAHALHRKGHTVCVVTLGDDRTEYPFPVKRVSRAFPFPVRFILLFLLLLRDGWRSEVWYINGLELPAVLAGKVLRKRLIMKVVGDYAWERAMNAGLTSDGIDAFQHARQHWNVEIHKTLRAWLARQMRLVITPSYYLKGVVSGWGISEEQICVVYNGIEEIPEHLGTQRENREKLGLSERDYLILTVGRLVSWKGIDQLIQVTAQLDKRARLLVIGDGPEKNRLTNLAENLSVAHRVQFIGKTDRRQVLCYLNASDVFVLNSTYEGLPHVVLEALSVGIPVVATSAGGTPELVLNGKNGRLIAPSNPQELHQALSEIMASSSEQTQSIENTQLNLEQFHFSTMLKQTESVLFEMSTHDS